MKDEGVPNPAIAELAKIGELKEEIAELKAKVRSLERLVGTRAAGSDKKTTLINMNHPAALHIQDVLLDSHSVMHRRPCSVNLELGVIECHADENGIIRVDPALDRINTYLLRGKEIEIVMRPGYDHLKDW